MDENNQTPNDSTTNEKSNQAPAQTSTEAKKSNSSTAFVKEAKETKNFLINLFKSPFSEMKKVVDNPKSFFKIFIILLVIWLVIELLGSIIFIAQSSSYSYFSNLGMYFRNSVEDAFEIVRGILVPILNIALLAFILYLLQRKQKKEFFSILITVTIAKVPIILASIVNLLTYINIDISSVTTAFYGLCSVLSTILIYFSIKHMFAEEDENKVTKTFLIAMSIYYGISIILNFLNIYIY